MSKSKTTTSDRLTALCNQLQALLRVRHELPQLTATPSEVIDEDAGIVSLNVTMRDGLKILSVLTGDADLNEEESITTMEALRAEAHRCLCAHLRFMLDTLAANEDLLWDFDSKIHTKRTLGE